MKLGQKIKLDVTQGIIQNSEQEHRQNCMIAQALRLKLKAYSVNVTKTGNVYVNIEGKKERFTLIPNNVRQNDFIANNIYKFDKNIPVKPFSVTYKVVDSKPISKRQKLGPTPKTGEAKRKRLNGEGERCLRRYWPKVSDV